MHLLSSLAVALVALLHLWFLALEMFFWTKPLGMKAFGLKPEFAAASRVLAANQGLYNGFLAAGLIWGLMLEHGPASSFNITGNVTGHVASAHSVQLFFLGCVIVAGVFGAATASRKIFFVQALPAIIAAALVLLT